VTGSTAAKQLPSMLRSNQEKNKLHQVCVRFF